MQFQNAASRVEKADIEEAARFVRDYREHLSGVSERTDYDEPECFINLPADEALLSTVREIVRKKHSPALKYFILIGIGGSNLGAKALYDALLGYCDILTPDRFPKLLFLDTNDPEYAHRFTKLLSRLHAPEEILVNIVTKSGSTTETIANAELAINVLEWRFSGSTSRIVVTTDEGSVLWHTAGEKEIARLAIPKTVGGRFSVFSAAGLFPLALCGIDIEQLRGGARAMRDTCLASDTEKNHALSSAAILLHASKRGCTVHDMFVFHPELESLGKWYRQLLGESIGKEYDRDGKKVCAGITPTVSVGSTDLHSVGQLYLAGPRNIITTFVRSQVKTASVQVPNDLFFGELVSGIRGKEFGEIMEAILSGVQIAYQKNEIPFMEIALDDLSARSLGEFLQFEMMATLYLGRLLNVDPFGQPKVEDYKNETRRILGA